jgi:hypothetical protein
MVRAVSCWPLTAKGQIRSGASPCSLWDFWWIIWECYRVPPPPGFWFSTLNTASLILHTHSVIISKCSMIIVSSWLKIYTECTLIIRVNEPYQVPLEREVNPLKPELNPICYLLALLAHHFLHVSRIRVNSLTIRLLMSYIYGAPSLDVSRSHTTTQHSR